jgi:hypothetical protein
MPKAPADKAEITRNLGVRLNPEMQKKLKALVRATHLSPCLVVRELIAQAVPTGAPLFTLGGHTDVAGEE